MASVSLFRPTIIRRDKKTGNKVKKKGAIWWMGWRDPATKQLMRESTNTKSLKLAKQLAREQEEKLFRIAQGWYHPAEEYVDKTRGETVKEFLTNSRARYRPETTIAYQFSLSAFQRLIKPQLMWNITLNVVENFVTQRSGEVAATTVNKDLRHLKSFLRRAARLHYLAIVPDFSGVFLPVDESEPVRIPEADINAVFKALSDPELKLFRSVAWWRVFLQMALFLGARRGELLGLRWSRVSFADGSVKIHRETSKGGRDRTYEGADDLVALLKVWFESFDPRPSQSAAVLPWPHPTFRQLYVDWGRILKAAGIPKERRFVLHNCRSTCVSELLESSSPLAVKDWVGHASVTTTEKNYANTKKARRDIARKRKVR